MPPIFRIIPRMYLKRLDGITKGETLTLIRHDPSGTDRLGIPPHRTRGHKEPVRLL
jgi:hypothetical protein